MYHFRNSRNPASKVKAPVRDSQWTVESPMAQPQSVPVTLVSVNEERPPSNSLA